MNTPFNETQWLESAYTDFGNLPAGYLESLLESGSLIDNLSGKAGNVMQVSVIREGWYLPLSEESAYLDIPPGQEAYVREINLMNYGRSWVYARSIFPIPAYHVIQQELSELGSAPLGNILYQHGKIFRKKLEVANIMPQQALYSKAGLVHENEYEEFNNNAECVWGRRSSYQIEEYPMLLIEIFLPDLLNYLSSY